MSYFFQCNLRFALDKSLNCPPAAPAKGFSCNIHRYRKTLFIRYTVWYEKKTFSPDPYDVSNMEKISDLLVVFSHADINRIKRGK